MVKLVGTPWAIQPLSALASKPAKKAHTKPGEGPVAAAMLTKLQEYGYHVNKLRIPQPRTKEFLDGMRWEAYHTDNPDHVLRSNTSIKILAADNFSLLTERYNNIGALLAFKLDGGGK